MTVAGSAVLEAAHRLVAAFMEALSQRELVTLGRKSNVAEIWRIDGQDVVPVMEVAGAVRIVD